MFMGQWQQHCAVWERRNDHHASRYHDQHEADGKAGSASCSALGCSLVHVGKATPALSSGNQQFDIGRLPLTVAAFWKGQVRADSGLTPIALGRCQRLAWFMTT